MSSDTFTLLFFLGIPCIIGLVFIILGISKAIKNEKLAQIENANRERYLKQYNNWVHKMNSLVADYDRAVYSWGPPQKVILVNADYRWPYYGEIRVYQLVQKVIILGKVFNFKDITFCKSEPYRTWIEKGAETIKTSGQSRGRVSMLGYSGNMFLGVGTTKQSFNMVSNVYREPDNVREEWIVIIHLNSYSEPLLPIYIGPDKMKAEEIVSLLNAIIRNQSL